MVSPRYFRCAAAVLVAGALLLPLHAAPIKLFEPGTEEVVNYEKYGTFEGVGTAQYKYTITDHAGLKNAVGEGVFPNVVSLFRDPNYKKLKASGRLNASHWEYTNGTDYERNFYKWASSNEDPGVKQYYTAVALEKAGNLKQAIKAYYSIVVNFPKAVGYTYWQTPWFIGPVAIDRIKYITHLNPKLGIKLVDAKIQVKNGFSNDPRKASFIVSPGKFVAVRSAKDFQEPVTDLSKLQVIKTVGKGPVQLVQYENHHWQMRVDDKPYAVRGIAYSPNKVGLSPDHGTLNVSRDWMFADFNKNNIIDGPYEAFVDRNNNNKQDRSEPAVGDFQLMKDMGVNTLRLYHHEEFNKELLMDGYKKYGFRYLMGDFIGMYAVGSKADWYTGTDYTNPVHQQNMLASVRKMVEDYKDEPYILMWVLGNENNYGAPGKAGVDSGNGCRARIQPEAYYKFVNEAAKLIKSLDPQQRPVAICNGDELYLDICAANAPELDVFGANAYRGDQGFGTLWEDVADVFDRPVVITEYGCSAYAEGWTLQAAADGQAKYLEGNWTNIENNMAGKNAGNALGGILFEWTDEWWKGNSDVPESVKRTQSVWYAKHAAEYKDLQPGKQDTVPQFGAPFLDGWSYEEWLGVVGQGDGTLSPFLRHLRPAYFTYKRMWEKYK